MRHRFVLLCFLSLSMPIAITSAAGAQCAGSPIVDTFTNVGGMVVDDDRIFVGLNDYRSGEIDVFAQMINLSGEPQWGTEGTPIFVGEGHDLCVGVVPDGLGGVFIFWDSSLDISIMDIYGAHVDETGTVVWERDLTQLPYDSYSPSMVSDGANGFIMVWMDWYEWFRYPPQLLGTRRDVNGDPVWAPSSFRVFCNNDEGLPGSPKLVTDGAGGAFAVWNDGRNVSTVTDIYATRITSVGGTQPWGQNGRPVSAAIGRQEFFDVVPDGVGGIFVVWADDRSGAYDIYAQRMTATGIPMWTLDGVAVSTAPGDQRFPNIAPDGLGGALIGWEHGADAYAQRLDPNGVKLWPSAGIPLSVASDFQRSPHIAADLTGGGYFVWDDTRPTTGGLYGQHVDGAGIANWGVNGTRICSTGSDGYIARDGAGGAHLLFNENDNNNNTAVVRYARLSDSPPTRVGDTPSVPADRLSANVPNPFRGTTEFRFYAVGATSISAEVFDVSGRRVATYEVAAPRAGWQPIVVNDRDTAGQELSSGVYFVRVRSGETVATRKMVIMR